MMKPKPFSGLKLCRIVKVGSWVGFQGGANLNSAKFAALIGVIDGWYSLFLADLLTISAKVLLAVYG